MKRLALVASVLSAADLEVALQGELAKVDPQVIPLTEDLAVAEIRARLSAAWENGWQPRDLRHVAEKGSARLVPVTTAAVVDQAEVSGAFGRAPEEWRAQLETLRADLGDRRAAVRSRSLFRVLALDGVIGTRAWADVLTLVKLLAELGSMPPLGPPPSRWSRQPAPPVADRHGDVKRDHLLTRIRALLAKAESTDHPAEADAFTAKAQELMSRHGFDEALLRAETEEAVPVFTRRVHLQSPYASVKVHLLACVARPNRARTIYHAEHAIASVVGTPADVDLVEMLFTSLLIQATREMAAAGKRAGSFDRSVTFRRSFLTAYAIRVGERLEETDRSTADAYGRELVPVLKREADAVDAEFTRLFPRTKAMRGGALDRRGYEAGRSAADRAVFTAGRLTG